MEFGLREWLVLLGVLVIVVIFVDGLRRMRRSQTKSSGWKVGAGFEGDNDDEALSELPNGGARVLNQDPQVVQQLERGKPAQQKLDLDDPVPVLMESIKLANKKKHTTSGSVAPQQTFKATHPVNKHRKEPVLTEAEEVDEELLSVPSPEPEVTASPEHDSLAVAINDEDDEDALASEMAEITPLKTEAKVEEPATAHPDEIIIIHVMSQEEQGFDGQTLLQMLLACGLRFGEMSVFHCHKGKRGEGERLFSCVNSVEPGIFDLDNMEKFYTPGVTLFATLPGPSQPMEAFDTMVEAAQYLTKHLPAELHDEAHSVLTPQTIEHYRQRIREFQRHQLSQRHQHS